MISTVLLSLFIVQSGAYIIQTKANINKANINKGLKVSATVPSTRISITSTHKAMDSTKASPAGEVIDGVVSSGTVTCVLERVIAGLLKHTIPRIVRIFVITPPHWVGECKARLTHQNVICVNEQSILPMRPSDILAIRSEDKLWHTMEDRRPGWYLAMLLKMFAATTLPLREKYVVWEADNILVKPHDLYINGKYRINIGGAPYHSYSLSTIGLLGVPTPRFDMTTHQMFVYKPLMIEMIRKMCRAEQGALPPNKDCATRIIRALPVHEAKNFHVNLGLSEYELYHTWALHRIPKKVQLSDYCPFIRITKEIDYKSKEACTENLPPSDEELLASAIARLEKTRPELWNEDGSWCGHTGAEKHRVFNRSRVTQVMLEVETVKPKKRRKNDQVNPSSGK